MTPKPPSSQEQYTARFMRNMEVTGHGFDVTQHFPCAWCAARNFMVVKIINAATDLAKHATCATCGRSGTNLVQLDNDGSVVQAEFVQIGGDEPPEWMEDPPRRVEV